MCIVLHVENLKHSGNVPTAPHPGTGSQDRPGVCPLAPDPALLPTALLAQGFPRTWHWFSAQSCYRDVYKMILDQVFKIHLCENKRC